MTIKNWILILCSEFGTRLASLTSEQVSFALLFLFWQQIINYWITVPSEILFFFIEPFNIYNIFCTAFCILKILGR